MPRVLLLEHVPGVGKKGEVKEVKHGYASNFLFPKNLAKIVTAQDEKKLMQDKKSQEAKRVELIEKRHEIAEKLNGQVFQFTFKTTGSGKIFGSVGEKDILQKIKSKFKIELAKKHIDMGPDGHLKKVGERQVFIKLGKDVHCKITVKAVEK
ncbi:MAG: 50S ribosomal protein L9 [Candidatus Gracilibacteria bacterium]|nr:50S ribosomal protein L9 [Candidatus Gracilibacteria bacterium]